MVIIYRRDVAGNHCLSICMRTFGVFINKTRKHHTAMLSLVHLLVLSPFRVWPNAPSLYFQVMTAVMKGSIKRQVSVPMELLPPLS